MTGQTGPNPHQIDDIITDTTETLKSGGSRSAVPGLDQQQRGHLQAYRNANSQAAPQTY